MTAIEERIVANGHGALSPSYFCVHTTANTGATAENHASLWSRQPDYAVHLVSDWEKCLHTVPYDRLCWQVGNGNGYVEGIEICEAAGRAEFEAGIAIAAKAVAERLKAHGWGTDRLVTHKWCAEKWGGSDHTDPYPYFEKWGYSWERFVSAVESAMSGGEWVEDGGRWWYKHADGSYTSDGWEEIDGRWYLFDADGWMLTGWQQRGGSWYYLNESHDGGFGAMLTGWQLVGGKWYFLDESGAMATGWKSDGSKWYYMDGDGAMQTGWVQDGGKWYWMNPDGSMSADEVKAVGDTFYAFDESGKMLSHALKVQGVDA